MKKTIGLWLVLIVMFVAFYRIFSVPPGQQALAPPTTTSSAGPWLQIIPLFFIVFVVFFFVIWRAQKRARPTLEAVRLLNRGRYSQALEAFLKIREQQPKEPVAVYNCGVTRLHLWQFDAALRDLEAARAMPGKKEPIAALLPEHLALVYALVGRPGEANQALLTVPETSSEPGRVAVVKGVLLLRAGDAAGAREKLGSFEAKQLGGVMGALARTTDALCIEQLTGEKRHVDRIALFGETGPEGLRQVWPELIAFVERAPAW